MRPLGGVVCGPHFFSAIGGFQVQEGQKETAHAAVNGTDSVAEDLPVDSLREAAPHLRRPFSPEAIKFKVQTVFSGASGCLVVAYIDARLAVERFNAVCPDLWSPAYRMVDGSKLMWCDLTVDGVTRSDVGESPKGMSKDLVSDALKRAAVHFGVGVSVYALPQIALYMSGTERRIEVRGKEKKTVALTEYGHTKLREGYAKWLAEHGEARFGPVLDHGDVEGATLDEEAAAPEEFVPEPAPALDDDKAKTLTAAIKAAYDRFKAAGGTEECPPAKYQAWLAAAAHSHDELSRLLRHFEQRREEMAAAREAAA
jgi:hypothetical protein